MKSCKPIEVLIYKHPFKSERESVEVERNTFRKIYQELDLEWDIDDYIILDGDEIVKDYSAVPKSEYISIKCVPKGGMSNQAAATAEKAVGAMVVIAAVAIAISPIGLTAGVLALGVSGLMAIGGGVILYNTKYDYGNTSSGAPLNSPSISGSKNSVNPGGRIPVLLGRHLTFPFVASNFYTTTQGGRLTPPTTLSESSVNQYLHLLLCSGYANMEIHENTLQFGDIPISSYEDVWEDVNGAYTESRHQNIHYPVRVVQDNVGSELKRLDIPQVNIMGSEPPTPTEYEYIVRTTPKNTQAIDITLLFPSGLYYVDKDGDKESTYSRLALEWKSASAPDSAYQTFGSNFYGEYLTPHNIVHIETNIETTARSVIYFNFPNTNPDKQYTIRVSNVSTDCFWGEARTKNKLVDTVYWEDMKSYTVDDSGNTYPINPDIKENLNVTSWKIRATDQLSQVVDDINYEATAYSRQYLGSGSGPSRWVNALTSNPASAFVKVLTDSRINQKPILPSEEATKIDWESLETWWTFCNDKGLECNAYEVGDVTVNTMLNNICSTAMASWAIVDNKYTIIIDTYNYDIIQYFTPRNSSNFSGSKMFNDIPTCLKMQFVDKDNGYIEGERYVYYDSYNGDPRANDLVEEVALYGAMGADQAWRLGRYTHASVRLRPEIFSFTTDIEYIMCTRGDRIRLNHDVPLFGLSNGRIVNPIQDSGLTMGIVLDELMQFEEGKEYGVTIRLQDGTSIEKNVVNPAIDTTTVLFETPITGEDILFEDDLVLFGERGSKDVDLIVQKIEPNDDLGATITCVEYNEAIYTADTSIPIPPYDPKISKGGSSTINVGSLPESQEDKVAQTQQVTVLTDQITYSMNAKFPDSFQSTSVQGWYPSTFDEFNYIYVNYDDGNTIYKKTLMGDENGVKINNVSSRYPQVMGDHIYYINQEDGGKIYQKGKNDTNDGVAFTTNAIDMFVVDATTEDIYYINPSDHNYIYKIPEGTSGNGVLLKDVSAGNIGVSGSVIFYTSLADSFIYTFDITDIATIVPYYTNNPVQEFHVNAVGYCYYLKAEDFVVYRKSAGTLGLPDKEGDPIYGVTTGFGVTDKGDVIFSSPDHGGVLFMGISNNSIQNASLESVATSFALTGNIVLGSNAITGVSAEDLDQVVVKDRLIGGGIPDDTFILMKGNNFIYMTNVATATLGSTSIQVNGSRITLNANRVVIPGTVTAELLEASAIRSRGVGGETAGGYPVTELDLDNGDMRIRRKSDDTLLLNFDSSAEKLSLQGTVQSENYSASAETGWKIDENGNAVFNEGTFRGDLDAATINGGTINGTEGTFNGTLGIASLHFPEVELRSIRLPGVLSGGTVDIFLHNYFYTPDGPSPEGTVICEGFVAKSTNDGAILGAYTSIYTNLGVAYIRISVPGGLGGGAPARAALLII